MRLTVVASILIKRMSMGKSRDPQPTQRTVVENGQSRDMEPEYGGTVDMRLSVRGKNQHEVWKTFPFGSLLDLFSDG